MPQNRQRDGNNDTDRIKRVLEVCDLLYYQKWQQNDIAKKLGISAATVTRDIEYAFEQKLVRFTLHPPQDIEIAQELGSLLNTADVRRVCVSTGSAKEVGHAAARFFEDNAHDDLTVVLDGGRTVSYFVESLAGGKFKGFSIIPIAADPPSYDVSAYELMTRMAVKYRDAESEKLPHRRGTPLLETSRQQIIEKARKANFVFLGTGPLEQGKTALDYVAHLGLDPADVCASHPDVACMCGYLAIDEAGRQVALGPDLADRLPRSLEFDDLVSLAAGDCHVVLLAADREKLVAVNSVIKARICNTLIVNDELGAGLLEYWRPRAAATVAG